MSQEISSSEFQSLVIEAQGPVIVDFFATWCGPCRMVAPVLEEIEQEQAGKAAFYKVDIDRCPDIAMRYGITAVPTIARFDNGERSKQVLGAQPKQALLQLLN